MKKFTNSGQFKKGQPSIKKERVVSAETREKQRLAKLGKMLPENVKIKMRGKTPWNKGLVGIYAHSTETRMKISASKTGIPTPWLLEYVRGENNVNWKGGISKIDKRCRRMPEYKSWRSSIFERDNYKCKKCDIGGVYITAHHIKGFSQIILDNSISSVEQARSCGELWDLRNGVTLCEECHSLTDNYKGRGVKNATLIN